MKLKQTIDMSKDFQTDETMIDGIPAASSQTVGPLVTANINAN